MMKLLILLVSFLFVFISPVIAVTPLSEGSQCLQNDGKPKVAPDGTVFKCDTGLACKFLRIGKDANNQPFRLYTCQKDAVGAVFGRIEPPEAVANFGFGAAGISNLLNMIINLIYIAAAVIFVFWFLWGALEWMLSAGDKEKVGNAQKRITHAIIGIILLAIVWVIIQAFGQITGFKFFAGQTVPQTTITPSNSKAGRDSICCPVGFQHKVYYCLGYDDNGRELRYPPLVTCPGNQLCDQTTLKCK